MLHGGEQSKDINRESVWQTKLATQSRAPRWFIVSLVAGEKIGTEYVVTEIEKRTCLTYNLFS
jgi:hypothetical protein